VFVRTWVLVLSGISDLGLPTTMIRLLPEYLQRSEHALLRGLLRGGRAAAVLSGTLMVTLVLAPLWLAGDRHSACSARQRRHRLRWPPRPS
jgi:hypothetical protein